MKRCWPFALAVSLLALTACNIGPGRTSPTPTATPIRTPTQRPAFATATLAASPTKLPVTPTSTSSTPSTPVALPNITVSTPQAGDRVVSPLRVMGTARVFEGNVHARLLGPAGQELARGTAMASAGAPERGPYELLLRFTPPAGGGTATLEVYSVSARDGSPENVVRVPVILGPP